jgi:hypothetical protein
MIFTVLFVILLLLPLVWVTVRGVDAWPFSHYPMFSQLMSPNEVEVFRVALETDAGEVVWWRSDFYRYPEFVGRTLKRIHRMSKEGGKIEAVAALETQRCLAEVLRLIEVEEGNANHYRAFHLIRRSIDTRGDKAFSVKDQTVARIPFGSIKRINRAG